MNRTHPPSSRGPATGPAQDPRGRRGAATPGFGAGLGALSDILTGGVRGATAATLGLPGDLEKLLRGLYGAAAARPEQDRLAAGLMASERSALPSTDEWRNWLPGPTEFSIPAEQNTPMQVAEFGALSPGQAARVVGGLGRMARPAAAGLGRVGAEALRRGVEEARGPLSAVGQAIAPQYAVRPRGGNFNTVNLNAYLGGADDVRMGANLADGKSPPTQQWAQKQLANYLKRDLGAPTDPLLALEAELPNLHFASEDPMEVARATLRNDEAAIQRNPRGLAARRLEEHNHLSGGQPLTPWGLYSGDAMSYSGPEEYAADLSGGWVPEGMTAFDAAREQGHNVDWLEKAGPDTKIWGLDPPDEDRLGFSHVLDYLDAAQRAHQKVRTVGPALRENLQYATPEERSMLALYDAGLALSPDQIGKTGVADAVRKTASWNELLASGMGGPQNPDLLKGWKGVHKEYPDDGMKWVELGPQDAQPVNALPEGYAAAPHPTLKAPDGQPLHGIREPNGFTYLRKTPEEAQSDWLQQHNLDLRKKDLSAGLKAEGDVMGHCVGGYCDPVASGKTRIFSLRDKAGNPHVTIETRPSRQTFVEEDHIDLEEVVGALQGRDEEFAAAVERAGGDVEDVFFEDPRKWAEKAAQLRRGAQVDDIVQIKGKQNAKPVDKYLPYVQDFVKGGNWGKVGDLQNTGLRTINERGIPGDFGRFSFASPEQRTQIWQQAGIDPAQAKYLDDADMKKLTGAYDALAQGRVPVRYGNDKLLEMVKQAKGLPDYESAQGLYTPAELRQAYEQSVTRTGGRPNQQDLQFLHNQIRNATPGDWSGQYFNPDVMPDDFYAPFAAQPGPGYAEGGSVAQSMTPFMQKAQAMLGGVAQDSQEEGYAGGGVVKNLAKLWHSGTIKDGEKIRAPLYTTPDKALARSYAATPEELKAWVLRTERGADPETFASIANAVGAPDTYSAMALDASRGENDPQTVEELIRRLKREGFDHAVLPDEGLDMKPAMVPIMMPGAAVRQFDPEAFSREFLTRHMRPDDLGPLQQYMQSTPQGSMDTWLEQARPDAHQDILKVLRGNLR